MKKLFRNWNFLKHLLFCIMVVLFLGIIDRFTGITGTEASSIGIIGGADGPTVIYLNSSWNFLPSIINPTALVVGLILYVPIKRLIKSLR